MRLHQVTSRLFTGPQMDPDQLLWCSEIGITHHLQVAREVHPLRGSSHPSLDTIENAIYDHEKYVTDDWLRSVISTGLDILSYPPHKLLITCLIGQNRSPSAAYAILRAFGLSQTMSKALSKGGTAPKYAHIVDRYLDRLDGRAHPASSGIRLPEDF